MKNLHVLGRIFWKNNCNSDSELEKNEACEEDMLCETNRKTVYFHKDVATNLKELKGNPPLEK